MNFANMLRERSQAQKATYFMFPFIRNVLNRKVPRKEISGARDGKYVAETETDYY